MQVVLATTNGSGMGHLARQSAVALALRQRGHDPILFSLSSALPLALGVHPDTEAKPLRGEYCVSYSTGFMPQQRWHAYYQARVQALLNETGARLVVFDGVVPYPGLLRARRHHPEVAFVWCRRGMWQPGLRTWALHAAPFFDLILEPGDYAAAADQGATRTAHPVQQVAPISLTNQLQALPRAQAAAQLGLLPDRPTALVTLPFAATAGLQAALGQLLEAGWQVGLTQGPIGATTQLGRDYPQGRLVRVESVFPLARYRHAFDTALAGAGYNMVHELLSASVPTLLVPRRETRTDDQQARALWLAEQGYALCADDDQPQALIQAVTAVSDPARRRELAAACASLPAAQGADQTAQALDQLHVQFSHHQLDSPQRSLLAALRGRDLLETVIGSRGLRALRRATGRRHTPVPVSSPPASQPQFSDTANSSELAALIASGAAVEHLLPESSARYVQLRHQLAAHTYS